MLHRSSKLCWLCTACAELSCPAYHAGSLVAVCLQGFTRKEPFENGVFTAKAEVSLQLLICT